MPLISSSSWLRQYGLVLVLAALCLAIAILNPLFLSTSNLLNILLQSTVINIVVAGMTLVIILGGIDLSVGSVVALSGILLGMLLHSGVPVSVSILLASLAGACCGALNGALTGYGRVPPFVATLAMFSAARGAALLFSNGRSISGFDQSVLKITSGSILLVPLPIITTFAVVAGTSFFLRGTYWGTRIYAIGGNPRAAWLSGLNLNRYRVVIYGLSGLLAGLAAVLLVSRLNAALPTAGLGYELDAIAAVVIGGASLSGGRGSVWGSLIGSLILAVLKNGLTILNVSSYFQPIVTGTVIILAVVTDPNRRKGMENEY
jgi:ribose transport system permease protein